MSRVFGLDIKKLCIQVVGRQGLIGMKFRSINAHLIMSKRALTLLELQFYGETACP